MTVDIIMGYFGFILTAIGVFLAFRSIRENIVYYEIETFGNNSGIGISHPGEIHIPPAEHLSARIYFWNSGPKAIRKQDIVEKITIKTKRLMKLNPKIVKTKEANNVVMQTFNENVLNIDFDFLNKKDGFFIELEITRDDILSINATLIDADLKNVPVHSSVIFTIIYFLSFILFCFTFVFFGTFGVVDNALHIIIFLFFSLVGFMTLIIPVYSWLEKISNPLKKLNK